MQRQRHLCVVAAGRRSAPAGAGLTLRCTPPQRGHRRVGGAGAIEVRSKPDRKGGAKASWCLVPSIVSLNPLTASSLACLAEAVEPGS